MPTAPQLSPAEWEVMQVLWEHGPLTARDVMSHLAEGHDWAANTVKTLLSRLVAKEAAAYEMVGNSYLYRPAIGRQQMTRQEVRSVVRRLMNQASGAVIAQFIDEAALTDDEIRELKLKLDEKRQRQRRPE